MKYTDPDGRIQICNNLPAFWVSKNVDGSLVSEKLSFGNQQAIVDWGYIRANDGTLIHARYKPEKNILVGENFDCHGFTFTNGQLWINNLEVEKILRGDGYSITTSPEYWDVLIQRDDRNEIIHSARIIEYDVANRTVTVKEAMGSCLFLRKDGKYEKTRVHTYSLDDGNFSFYHTNQNDKKITAMETIKK